MLEYYAYVTNYGVRQQVHKHYVPPPKSVPDFNIGTAVDITLSEVEPRTSSYVTAHRIRDYRRTKFTLMLLPSIDLLYDNLLEEVYSEYVSV